MKTVKPWFVSISLCLSCVFFMVSYSNASPNSDEILRKIEQRYMHAQHLKVFAIDYSSQSPFAPQSYDYFSPDVSTRRQITEIDFNLNSYFSRVIRGPFPGKYIFDTSEYQHQGERLRFDNNFVLYGKTVQTREHKNPIQFEIEELNMVVDILAVAELLNTPMLKDRLTIQSRKNEVVLTVLDKEMKTISYRFDQSTFDLLGVDNQLADYKTSFENRVQKNGLRFASNVTLINRGFESDYTIENLQEIDGISNEKLSIPMGYGPIHNGVEKPIAMEKLSDTIYVLSNVDFDRFVMVQVNMNELTVFGAPGKKATEQVVDFLDSKFPGKKVTSVYITHPHSDHISGLPVYAKLGAKIIADEYSISVIKSYPRFKEVIDQFSFIAITNKKNINGVTYYLPKNSHSKGQSFVYFNELDVIYEGDFLEIPLDNTIPNYMSDTDREFIEFVYDNDINVSRIVGHHRNGNISKSIMDQYYQRHHGEYAKNN